MHLKHLEQQAGVLEPDAAVRRQVFQQMMDYSQRYIDGITGDAAFTMPGDPAPFNQAAAITDDTISFETALSLLDEYVDHSGVNATSGRHLGYIPGGGLFYSAVGDYLAAIANRYTGIYFAAPGAVQIENTLVRWLATEMGYPETASGNLASGGSIANLTAVITARDDRGISSEAIPRSVVYVTTHVHHCIDKALHVAGLRQCIKRTVPVDAQYRMDARALDTLIAADKQAGLNPWLVVASAGTTSTGAVDPLTDIGQIAAAHHVWMHVDGAYGGLFVLCPEGKSVLRGIEASDSLVADPHKTLFLPYGTGAVLVKDRQKQFAAFSAEADYIQILDDTELSPSDLSPELTRHFRGLRLWLPLKLLGVAPFRAALSEKIHLARYFYEKMQQLPGFEVGAYPDLSIVTYRYCPKRGDADAFNERLMQSIVREGRFFLSGTRIDGKFVLRAAVMSFRTHQAEIDEILAILQRHAAALEQG